MSPQELAAIRSHYDRLSFFYRALWGRHIHHGYWEGDETTEVTTEAAQLKLVKQLAARARIPQGAHILDVGCGVGGSSLWLARHFGTVLGITISPVQARMATLEARAEGLQEQARFEVRDANCLDLPAESFDLIWVIEASEHLADKARFIETCARLLKADGALALCAWLSGSNHRRDGRASDLLREICHAMLCPGLASMDEYVDWMRAAGFAHIEAEDITRRVEKTWAHCQALASRPEVRALVCASDPATRRFVEAFGAMQQAYAEGALAYGMLTARRSMIRR